MSVTGPEMAQADRLRLDKWLFFARFAKSRSVAAALVEGGAIRINGRKVDVAARPVRVGDVLTMKLAGDVRLIRVEALGTRRGPASEARTLYSEHVDESVPAGEDAPV